MVCIFSSAVSGWLHFQVQALPRWWPLGTQSRLLFQAGREWVSLIPGWAAVVFDLPGMSITEPIPPFPRVLGQHGHPGVPLGSVPNLKGQRGDGWVVPQRKNTWEEKAAEGTLEGGGQPLCLVWPLEYSSLNCCFCQQLEGGGVAREIS